MTIFLNLQELFQKLYKFKDNKMRDNTGLVIFLIFMITVILGGFLYFSILISGEKQTAVKCKGDGDITISFLIDDEKSSVIMAGKEIEPSTINIFNKTAIAAAWKNKNIGTKIFLDRIAGFLEIETSNNLTDWEKQRLECFSVIIRF